MVGKRISTLAVCKKSCFEAVDKVVEMNRKIDDGSKSKIYCSRDAWRHATGLPHLITDTKQGEGDIF